MYDTMGFLLTCDLNNLPVEMQQDMVEWLQKNAAKREDGSRALFIPNASLLFARK